MRDLLPIGIVGAGRSVAGLGPFLAKFAEEEGFFVAGVSSRSSERAKANAEAIAHQVGHDVRATASPAELCGLGLAALVICSPTEFHLEALQAAAKFGVPTLCEKPLVHEDHGKEGAEVLEVFARKRIPLLENCQWPYTLTAFSQLLGPVTIEKRLTIELGLGPPRAGREMVQNTVSHLLSLIQAVGSLDPEAAVTDASIADLSFQQSKNLLKFCITSASGNFAEGLLHLNVCPVAPRPAWLAINGRRMDRHVRSGYEIAFSASGREVTIPDPTKELFKHFTVFVLGRDPVLIIEECDRIRQRLNWYRQIMARLE
jgi:hypothetical protein